MNTHCAKLLPAPTMIGALCRRGMNPGSKVLASTNHAISADERPLKLAERAQIRLAARLVNAKPPTPVCPPPPCAGGGGGANEARGRGLALTRRGGGGGVCEQGVGGGGGCA